jgi:hypothetical protein
MIKLIIAEIAFAAVVSLTFAGFYAARSDWRRSTVGRHLMAWVILGGLEGILLVLLGLGLPVPLWVFAALYAGLAFVGTQRLFLLLRTQNGSDQ